jgi:hypothetical protein
MAPYASSHLVGARQRIYVAQGPLGSGCCTWRSGPVLLGLTRGANRASHEGRGLSPSCPRVEWNQFSAARSVCKVFVAEVGDLIPSVFVVLHDPRRYVVHTFLRGNSLLRGGERLSRPVHFSLSGTHFLMCEYE